jgi:two-component system LytT family response regulator
MSKLRLLIVDDEPLIRKGLRSAASQIADIEVVGEAGSGSEAIQAIHEKHPDLVFLDVRMPDCTGLDVVGAIGPEKMPAVIFVTAYDEYAVKAFEINAVDYLLKPFDEVRLGESVERARRRIREKSESDVAGRLDALLKSNSTRWAEKLVVRNADRYEFVPVEGIDWIESADNYVELHCGVKHYLHGETLSSLEVRLDPSKFMRIHRRRIVNVSRIVAMHPLLSGTYEMELRTGSRLTTGRQYKDAVQQLMRS